MLLTILWLASLGIAGTAGYIVGVGHGIVTVYRNKIQSSGK